MTADEEKLLLDKLRAWENGLREIEMLVMVPADEPRIITAKVYRITQHLLKRPNA